LVSISRRNGLAQASVSRKFKKMLPEKCRLTLRFRGAPMGITQHTLRVVFDHSAGRFSPRKLIPINPKTVGDHILLKRIKADLSQPEVTLNAGVSEQTIRAWEHDQSK
jgi:hypothetical protein